MFEFVFGHYLTAGATRCYWLFEGIGGGNGYCLYYFARKLAACGEKGYALGTQAGWVSGVFLIAAGYYTVVVH